LEADARLVAAAPDLLAALQKILARLRTRGDSCVQWANMRADDNTAALERGEELLMFLNREDCVSDAFAAIDKATGETQ
jgi:hypothetical protein